MKEHTKQIIETLAPLDRHLLGAGYDNAMKYLEHLIELELIEFPSGTEFGTWTVPNEWVIKDASVRYVGTDAGNPVDGEDLLDFKNNPLSVMIGSRNINTRIDREELRKHWHYSDDQPDAIPFEFSLYDEEAWGICLPKKVLRREVLPGEEPEATEGVLMEEEQYESKFTDALPEGYYDVKISTEYRPGVMRLGVHTIKGKSDREILLFAHLDHPYQANDNLSGVACLVDLANKLKAEHTIKIIFCPETIGSIAYAHTQDLSKVDFVIAVDVCGNKNSILLQKSYDQEHRINRVAHLAIQSLGETYRKGQFRNTIGSDEYIFNDPIIGIPGIMLSTWPYSEYHTSFDTADKIDYEQIEKVGLAIQKTIEYWEKDFIPVRNFKGPLRRSKYGVQTPNKQVNLSWDYLIYAMDGKRTLAELCCDYGLNFEFVLSIVEDMIKDGFIKKHEGNSRTNVGKVRQQTASRKKHASVSGKANVSDKPRKVSKDIR